MKTIEIPPIVAGPGLLAMGFGTFLFFVAGLASQNAAEFLVRDSKGELLARLTEALARPQAIAQDASAAPEVIAANETLAAANMDALIRDRAHERGATIIETRAEPVHDSDNGNARRVSVHVVVEGRIVALQSLFWILETGRPQAMLDDLLIEPTGQTTEAVEDPLLRATFTAAAGWRPSP